MNKIKSITEKFEFDVVKTENGKEVYFFDRDNFNNNSYILNCAALAFHKALIGISELKAIEAVSREENAGGLRICKAMISYYVGFHTLISLMLIDTDLKLKTNLKPCNEKMPLEVIESELNSSDESPEQWNRCRDLESDLASKIDHNQIKDYCKTLRKKKAEGAILEPPFEILYENFIKYDESDGRCIDALYEKLCYIRDRAVYRPTYVIGRSTGGVIQTSLDVREEIEGLPDYAEFYNICHRIYSSIINMAFNKNLDENVSKKYYDFLRCFWYTFIKEDRDFLISIGWDDRDIEKLKFEGSDELIFTSYLSQLIEIADIKRVRNDYQTIWGPLKEEWEKNLVKKRTETKGII